jgi:alpha-beta hydrolase superfamily lysophospholipase
VILFHGLNSNKGNVLGEAFEFNSLGYNTMLVDMRAHGNSQGVVNTLGDSESEEVKLAYEYVLRKGERNIVLWGMSLGAVIITKAIWQYGLTPNKIILEMPFDRLQDHIRARARISGFPGEPFGFFVTFWAGLEHGYWGYGHSTTRYVKKINCPVLVQWGNNDEYVLKKETDRVFSAIKSANKQLEIYDAGHEPLVARQEEKWVRTVTAFLNN